MHIAIAKLESASSYAQGRHVDQEEHPKKPKEQPDDYELRTWRHRAHATGDGRIAIPAAAFAHCVKASARRLQIQVPGKGKTQFTKYFEAGVMVTEDLVLKDKAATVERLRLFVPSDGKPGGGRRVYRHFPLIRQWSGEVTFYILDDIITEPVFTQVLRSAGMLVGIGVSRPENRGNFGRFKVASLKWIEDGDAVVSQAAE